ncbi:MAG: hypothetical protein RSB82_04765 [Victivallaceae bacterium]
MFERSLIKSLTPDLTAKCLIANDLIVNNSLTAETVNLKGNLSVNKSVSGETDVSIKQNATINGKINIQGKTSVNNGLFMVNGSTIDMSNHKVINVPTPTSLSSSDNTLACNYGMMRYPVFYCKTTTYTTEQSWQQNTSLAWKTMTGRLYRSPGFNNYFRFEGNNIGLRFLRQGTYQISVAITKRRKLGNGYGSLIYLEQHGLGKLSTQNIWNKGGINHQVCLEATVRITSSNISNAVFYLSRDNSGGQIVLILFSYSILGFLEN